MTLIHEIMHLAGGEHRDKLDIDQPGDNGEYYESSPLRAEYCIAGKQSLRNCYKINGGIA